MTIRTRSRDRKWAPATLSGTIVMNRSEARCGELPPAPSPERARARVAAATAAAALALRMG